MRIAVVGATGLVGKTLLELLGQEPWLEHEVLAYAGDSSRGLTLSRGKEKVEVQPLPDSPPDVKYALVAVPNSVSKELVPRWRKAGIRIVDKSSAFRMDDDVPLVVPEVNADKIARADHLVATPNCSTTQLAVAVNPLRDAFGLIEVWVASYQSVSGAGAGAMAAWQDEIQAVTTIESPFPRPIEGNVIPMIGSADEDGWFTEEVKFIEELPKILGQNIPVSATAVRVPVAVGHGEAVEVRVGREVTLAEVHKVLGSSPGLTLLSAPSAAPTPREAAGRPDVLVGRVRLHPRDHSRILMWVVADNLRKGAATNALQIVEEWEKL